MNNVICSKDEDGMIVYMLIIWLLQEQSDLGLHCAPIPVCPAVYLGIDCGPDLSVQQSDLGLHCGTDLSVQQSDLVLHCALRPVCPAV